MLFPLFGFIVDLHAFLLFSPSVWYVNKTTFNSISDDELKCGFIHIPDTGRTQGEHRRKAMS